jgi:hypothetical protein
VNDSAKSENSNSLPMCSRYGRSTNQAFLAF